MQVRCVEWIKITQRAWIIWRLIMSEIISFNTVLVCRNISDDIKSVGYYIGHTAKVTVTTTSAISLTTGLCTSQNALSWLSRIFLSILSLFLSTLRNKKGVQKRFYRACRLFRHTYDLARRMFNVQFICEVVRWHLQESCRETTHFNHVRMGV